MSVSLSAAIMTVPGACPDRDAAVKALHDQFRAARVPVEIVADPLREGTWPTSRRCWARAQVWRRDWHMVLQDDVVMAAGVPEALMTKVLPLVPGRVVTPYANRKVIEEARAVGASWAEIPDGTWGQGLLMPSDLAREMVEWCDAHTVWGHDDARIATWCIETGVSVLATVPSLIDHMKLKSLLGHSLPRHARWFIGDGDPAAIDWSAGVDAPVRGARGMSRRRVDVILGRAQGAK